MTIKIAFLTTSVKRHFYSIQNQAQHRVSTLSGFFYMPKHIIKLQTISTLGISYTTKRKVLLTEDEVRGSDLCTMTPTVTQSPCNSALFNLRWILDSLISFLSAILYFISMLDIFGLLKKKVLCIQLYVYTCNNKV